MPRLLVIVTIFLAPFLVACSDVPDEVLPSPTGGSAATVTPTPMPVLDGPVQPLPEVSLVMERGERMAYSVCSRVTGWQKPDIEGMAQVFTDRRFGDGERPFPINYALYLQRAYYVPVPTANSANKENVAFSAQWAVGAAGERFCDYQALRDEPTMQSLWLIGLHIEEMRFLNGHLVVMVSEAPAVREDVMFRYPADPNRRPFEHFSLRVVDTDGRSVYQGASGAGTSMTLQRDLDERVVAMTVSGDASFTSWAVTFAEGQPSLRMFSAFAPPTSPLVPAGTLELLDAQGATVLTVSWPEQEGGWQQLATLEVPPGSYEIHIEAQCARTCSYVFIAGDVALP